MLILCLRLHPVQFALNGGRPVGASIPATEHSVMTAWQSERQAIENMIETFGTGFFACVMDSYDYEEVCSADITSPQQVVTRPAHSAHALHEMATHKLQPVRRLPAQQGR